MSEKPKLPAGGLALAFSGVAVVAAVGAVMISTRGGDVKAAGEQPAAASSDGATPSDEQILSVQSAPETPQPPTPGAAGVQSADTISVSDPSLVFSAALPSQEEAGPIAARLRKEADDLLAKKLKEAHEMHADARAEGRSPIPWEYQIEWKVLGRASEWVSLVGTLYQFEGGAHGLGTTDTRIANYKTGEEIAFPDMLRFGKGFSPAVVIATCEALKKEKRTRIGSDTVMDEPTICAGPNANVRLEDASIGLAPSNVAGKFGGLYVYFDPYAVGSYAEGSYQVAIPHEVFAEDLKAPFKTLFAGSPVPFQEN
jgi:hypothetical protein